MFPSSFQNQTVVGFHVSAHANVKVNARAHGLFVARDSRTEGEALLVVAGVGECACADHEADRDERLGARVRADRLGRDRN
jgi:hypothetical protein